MKRILSALILFISGIECHVEAGRAIPKDFHRSCQYDYIIIGNGTAGSVLARKLSDDCKTSVLVLEAGINRTTDPVVLDPNINNTKIPLTYDPKYAIDYAIQLLEPFQYFFYGEGRMWGGSSASNYLIAVRGTAAIWNQWASLSGNPAWSYNNVLPRMIDLETYTPNGTILNPDERGTNGPLFVTQFPPVNAAPFAIAVSNSTNTPFVDDYNDATQGSASVSAVQEFITPPPGSRRSFSTIDFLPIGSVIDAEGNGLNGRQLRIISNALASRVLFEENAAVGVEFLLADGHQHDIQCVFGRNVILCAGAVNSPAILQRSGIGDADLLESLDIDVIVDNPNVGANLNNQYGTTGIIQGTSTVLPLLNAFIDGSPFMPNNGARRYQLTAFNENGNIRVNGPILNPGSLGSIKIVAKNPMIVPLIDLNLYSDGPVTTVGTDAYLAVSFFKILKNIAASFGTSVLSPPAADFPPPYGPAPDDSLLLEDAIHAQFLNITNNIVGTTKMATSIEEGVVDGELNVFGVTNLKVVDVGIAPIPINGNQGYAAYVIALVAAAQILGTP